MTTKDYLKDVLAGNRKLMRMSDIRFVNIPAYNELNIDNLYLKALKQPEMSEFFPKSYPKGRKCDRAYFFNIWNTKYPE